MSDAIKKTAKIIEPEKPVEFRHLTDQCGPHCGAIATIGSNHVTVGHCAECHGPNQNAHLQNKAD
jgi:hypothetical protein